MCLYMCRACQVYKVVCNGVVEAFMGSTAAVSGMEAEVLTARALCCLSEIGMAGDGMRGWGAEVRAKLHYCHISRGVVWFCKPRTNLLQGHRVNAICKWVRLLNMPMS